MKRPPFKIRGSEQAVYRRGGKFVTGGKTTWCWETLVQAIASGVPGPHEIRRAATDRQHQSPWYTIEMTVEEAEQALDPHNDFFGRRRVARARKFRARMEALNAHAHGQECRGPNICIVEWREEVEELMEKSKN